MKKNEPIKTHKTKEVGTSTYYLDEMENGTFRITKDEKIVQAGIFSLKTALKHFGIRTKTADHSKDAVSYLTKATPGPWEIEEVTGNKDGYPFKDLVYCRINADRKALAFAGVYGSKYYRKVTEEEAKANARIMANSRELFDACDVLLQHKDAAVKMYGEFQVTMHMVEDLLKIQAILEKTK